MESPSEQTLPRSSGAIKSRRKPLPWPNDQEFRILSIDGGGIRGIFPAAILAGLEKKYLQGESISNYFDLIAGTSTGGIIALGLGAGFTADRIYNLYLQRGLEIFPPRNPLLKIIDKMRHALTSRYNRVALERILNELFGERTFGESKTRLCIPSSEGKFDEVFIFKTPHHPDYKKDWAEKMTKVGLATSAAHSYFKPLEDGGYIFLDGGIWCNNPVMVALVDALACHNVPRHNIRILSLGCDNSPQRLSPFQKHFGGFFSWLKIIFSAMRLESQNAQGQACLLVGSDRVTRIDPPRFDIPIALDDWDRASKELPPAATKRLEECGESIASTFLQNPSSLYEPCYPTISNSPTH